MSVDVLARQVKQLQNAQAGTYQKNFQLFAFNTEHDHFIAPKPILFALNNFTYQTPVMIGRDDTTTYPGLTVPGFVINNPWLNKTADFGFDNYSYWQGANDDTADPSSYQPISTNVKFTFTVPSMYASSPPVWIRLDVIKCKKALLYTNMKKLALPNNVQSLSHLAHDDQTKRNRINREYFEVVQTKWLCIRHDTGTGTTQNAIGHMSIKHQFKASEKATQTLGAGVNEQTPTGIVNSTFHTNMPEDEVYWCLLNTSYHHENHPIQITASRFISYRDHLGVSS